MPLRALRSSWSVTGCSGAGWLKSVAGTLAKAWRMNAAHVGAEKVAPKIASTPFMPLSECDSLSLLPSHTAVDKVGT